MTLLRHTRRVVLLSIAMVASICIDGTTAQAQQLLPDIVPWVREDAPYLVNWDITSGNLRMQTMFANIGDGLLQLRTDLAGTGGATTPLNQRVFNGVDNGPIYQDYFVENALNFHQAHGHIHFDNFSEFQLRQVVMDAAGVVSVGSLVANTVKTSYRISDTARIPDPLYASKVSYPSSNTGLYQNISVGFGDIYSHGTEGQSISLTGVAYGPKYWLRQTVDPSNVLHEKNELNNSFEIMIDLNKPGQALLQLDGSFVQPGEVMPLPPGDLTGDRLVNIQDWLAFKANASVSLTGVSNETAIMLGDLNLDHLHSLTDVRLFREYYDDALGVGAFAEIQNVPEPATLFLVGLAAFLVLPKRSTGRSQRQRKWVCFLLIGGAGWAAAADASANNTLFSENFDGLVLGPNVDETVANAHAWTQTPPAGWIVDDSGVPFVADATRGVAEWEGWSFANKDWWVSAAGDQQRGEFALGQGTVAVADPDEWDDKGNPINGTPFAGYYNALFKTPAIPLAGVASGTVKLAFSSSWRDECCDDGPSPQTNNQTARVRVSYNNGASFGEVLRWESNSSSAFFKNDATNEAVVVNLNNPVGATSAIIEFGLLNAGNDWWWAIDNVQVFTPTVLEVNTTTGKMTILGATELTGYEITSGASSLDGVGWKNGNLDAQNFGPATLLSADFNNSNSVNAADYVQWRNSVGSGAGGDANGDGVSDQLDYDLWRQQFGQSLAAGQSWESIINTNKQLLEFFLLGSSTFASRSVGIGYNTAIDARDLAFKYSMAGGQEFIGVVRYVSGAGAGSSTVPEPATWAALALGMIVIPSARRRRTNCELVIRC